MRRQITAEELHDFYTLIGRAVWHFQYFEDLLVTFISMKSKIPREITLEEANEILDKERRKTLGGLINEAKSVEIIPQGYQERFRKILNERNWLIHRSWKENGEDLYINEKRFVMMKRIDFIYKESIDLKKILFEIFSKWCEDQGVDMAKANQIAFEKISKLKGS